MGWQRLSCGNSSECWHRAILMQGFANREAVATTLSSRKATFYSRSRSTLWTKGETSNNFINIHDVFLDCDCDYVSTSLFLIELFSFSFLILVSYGMLFTFQIIYLGKPDGPTCHTGRNMLIIHQSLTC